MKRNTGNLDRVIRLIAGLLVIGGGIYFQSWFGAFGLYLLATALFGWCAVYALFGIRTCQV